MTALRANADRIALACIAVFMAPVGVQAALFPRSFYDDFPIGRGWIALTGDPYSEHLVRDVGALFLALVGITLWVAIRKGDSRALAVAWLMQGALHLWYHVGHLDHFRGVDKVGLVGSLATIPLLAIVALVSRSASST